MGDYRCIVVDPPWPYGAWRASPPTHRPHDKHRPLPYPALSVAAITALPMAALAAAKCELYLWTTQRYLPAAFGVLEVWGFRYCQTLAWCKSPMGTGQGGVYTPTTEFALLARRGRMPHTGRVPTTWFHWKRTRSHSTKPEAFFDLVETVSEAPRLEVFARRRRLGWTAVGDELSGEPIEESLRRLAVPSCALVDVEA